MEKAEVIIFGSSGSQDSCNCNETLAAAGCDGCKSNGGYMIKETACRSRLLMANRAFTAVQSHRSPAASFPQYPDKYY